MSFGRRNDYEVDLMCAYVQWLKYAVRDFPEDAQLRAFGRKCYLITMQRLIEESARLRRHDTHIYEDMVRECAECDRSGYRQCQDEKQGKACKYKNPEYGREALTRNFGEEALSYIDKYIPAMTAEGGKTDDEGTDRPAAV